MSLMAWPVSDSLSPVVPGPVEIPVLYLLIIRLPITLVGQKTRHWICFLNSRVAPFYRLRGKWVKWMAVVEYAHSNSDLKNSK